VTQSTYRQAPHRHRWARHAKVGGHEWKCVVCGYIAGWQKALLLSLGFDREERADFGPLL
jgi:hypothetical protein